MSARDVVRRLEAFAAGRPLPRGQRLQVRRPAKSDLRVAFLRLGGESSPWGVAWRAGSSAAQVLSVPDARRRDDVAAMAAQFAPALLAHLGHPAFGQIEEGQAPAAIWLPNPTHVEMFHFLTIAFTFARKGEPERILRLNALGRAAGWLFREAERPGQVVALDATRVLRDAFTFPADDIRQAHLGYLLAWLTTAGNATARRAAASVAEQESVATSLDPEVERRELAPQVERRRDAEREQDEAGVRGAEAKISGVLKRELLRRLDLVDAARAALQSDPRDENKAVEGLVHRSASQHWRYRSTEERLDSGDPDVFIPSPVTDRNPLSAAIGYRTVEASEQVLASVLLHDDADLFAEAVAAGDGFRGRILSVRDEGTGRAMVPVWRVFVKGDGPLRLREGSSVCVVGLPSREGEIRDVRRVDKGRELEIEITGLKRGPREPDPSVLVATDARLKKTDVEMIGAGPDPFQLMKISKIFNKEGPGAWLTHARPETPEPSPADGDE